MKIKTNFGSINKRRVVTFKVSEDGMVLPSRFKRHIRDGCVDFHELRPYWITSREAFRRWKIARKAWKSRKWKNQLPLPL